MYYEKQPEEKFCRPDLWSNIDLVKVKQRIDEITYRMERVRRKFEPSEADYSKGEKD